MSGTTSARRIEANGGLTAGVTSECQPMSPLARFKCPRRVDFVDHLPRTDSGKLYKRRLRDEYRARAAAEG